jgi:Sec-independent protein translocase protein TatA
VGFGTEILFMLLLGFLLFGPKRLPTILGHVARAKTQFEKASRSLRSQLEVELAAQPHSGNTDSSQELDKHR